MEETNDNITGLLEDNKEQHLKILERAAIDYFKEKVILNKGTKIIIVTDGVNSYIAPKAMGFFPKENELVFEVRAKTMIEVKRLPWVTEEEYNAKKEKEKTKRRRIL
jgi:hypothetical protein